MVTRDFLGPFSWWPEFLAQYTALGIEGCPFWAGPRGCVSNIALATGLLKEVTDTTHILQAVNAILEMEPLCLDKKARAECVQKGHTVHGSISDIVSFIGSYPRVEFELTEELARGFSAEDQRVAGNWRRAANQGPQQVTRTGTELARPAGAPAARDNSEHVYERGVGRLGGSERQMRAISRVCRFVEAGLRHWGIDRPISEMPDGQSDWRLIIPFVEDTEA